MQDLKYKKIIADDNSSAFCKLKEQVDYGREVRRLVHSVLYVYKIHNFYVG